MLDGSILRLLVACCGWGCRRLPVLRWTPDPLAPAHVVVGSRLRDNSRNPMFKRLFE
jgi:hypothetical protein